MRQGTVLWARWVTLALLVLPMGVVWGQWPRARLHSLSPLGAPAGSQLRVQTQGNDLDQAYGLWFSSEWIQAKPVEDVPGSFDVTIDPKAVDGLYEARVVGRFGVSAPRTFVVTRYPVFPAVESRTDENTPQEVAIGTIIDAQVAVETVDHYRFQAEKGQKVMVEVAAQSLDSKMRPALSIRQGPSREFISSHIRERVMFIPPESGAYEIYVSDHIYRGGPEFFYQLRVSTDPEARAVFPPIALTDPEARYEALGWNLPETLREVGTLEVASVPVDAFQLQGLEGRRIARDAPYSADLRLEGPQWGLPGLNHSERTRTLVCAEPTLVEPESMERIQVTLPVAIGGRFYPRKDRDRYEFEARVGAPIWIHIDAERLGEAVNPFGLLERVIKNSAGERTRMIKELYGMEGNLGGSVFNTNTSDFHWRFDPPETGRYRLTVWDLFNTHRDDPGLVYRLTLRFATPNFDLIALPEVANYDNRPREAKQWPMFLRKGGAQFLRVIALREDGFDGSIALTLEDLPATVQVSGAEIPSGAQETILTLRADRDSVGWGGRVRLTGRATIDDRLLARDARVGVTLWDVQDTNNEAAQSRLSPHLYLAVSDEELAPVEARLSPLEAEVEGTPDSVATFSVQLVRREGYEQDISLTLRSASPIKDHPPIVLAPDVSETRFTIHPAELGLRPGRHAFQLHAVVSGPYQRPGAEAANDTKYAVFSETAYVHVLEATAVSAETAPASE